MGLIDFKTTFTAYMRFRSTEYQTPLTLSPQKTGRRSFMPEAANPQEEHNIHCL